MRGIEDDQREEPGRGDTGNQKVGGEAKGTTRAVCGHLSSSPQSQQGTSMAGHTSDGPAQECRRLGEQTGGIRSLWAVLEL